MRHRQPPFCPFRRAFSTLSTDARVPLMHGCVDTFSSLQSAGHGDLAACLWMTRNASGGRQDPRLGGKEDQWRHQSQLHSQISVDGVHMPRIGIKEDPTSRVTPYPSANPRRSQILRKSARSCQRETDWNVSQTEQREVLGKASRACRLRAWVMPQEPAVA